MSRLKEFLASLESKEPKEGKAYVQLKPEAARVARQWSRGRSLRETVEFLILIADEVLKERQNDA